jgi:hypothetical protein
MTILKNKINVIQLESRRLVLYFLINKKHSPMMFGEIYTGNHLQVDK